MSSLLVVNVSMNATSMLFSHQIKAVQQLSKYFSTTFVLTRENSYLWEYPDVKIIQVPWRRKKPVSNLIHLILKAMPILMKNKNLVVFTHMSDSMAAALSPITKFLGINHYLWYAHKTKSIYLRFAHLFLDGIITSTPGSCPYRGEKVFSVGQGIDISTFQGSNRSIFGRNDLTFFNYGRLDKSKRVDLLIRVVESLRKSIPNLTLSFFGITTSKESAWLQKLEFLKDMSTRTNYLNFFPPIKHANIATELRDFDIFIHAFSGSLDKTLLEVTLMKKPVVTCNPEYLEIFGSWSNSKPADYDDFYFLKSEIESILQIPDNELDRMLNRRRAKVTSDHSLERWAEQIYRILVSKDRT